MKPAALVRAALRIPTILRTLRPLRRDQLVAQIGHALFGVGAPCAVGDVDAQLAIARPATEFLPPPAHVRALGGERFALLATPFSLPHGRDWSARREGPLFAYHLHQHEYLRLDAFTPAERSAVVEDWIRSNPAGVGWDPHPTGLRLVAWGKLLTTPGSLAPANPSPGSEAEGRMLASFVDQAETLSRRLEIRLQANHLLSNLVCVVFAGLLVESKRSDVWRARSGLLLRELTRQVHPDGGHEERSPMYHAHLLEGLLDLLNLCRAAPERAPEGLTSALEQTAARMLRALALLTHRDGRIALFADSALDVAAEPDRLVDYARRLGVDVGLRDGEITAGAGGARARNAWLPDTGYVRLEAGDFSLLASVAGPAPAHQPGHAHCDALAFELTLGARRLVADTGVFEYVPGERRQRSRATASHATLQIDDAEQAEIWAAHRVGGRPEVSVDAGGSMGGVAAAMARGEAVASCRGWSTRDVLHRRRFRVDESGVLIEDTLEGRARRVESRIPLAPGWSVEWLGPRLVRCTVQASPDCAVEIELPEPFVWGSEQAPCYASFGREETRPVLVGRAEGAEIRAARTRFRRIA